MALDVPAVVVDAPKSARPLSVLGARESSFLVTFRETTGLALVDVPEDAHATPLPLDPERKARIERIEKALHAARTTLDLGEKELVPGVRVSVALAYAEARAHPEDPEAPFLVAELLRTLARVEELSGAPDAGRALRGRAALLDGGRRIGLSEGEPEATTGTAHAVVFSLLFAPKGTELWIDGARRDPGAIELERGEHHVRVTTEAGTQVARWLAIGDDATVSLPVGPDPVPCARADLEPALGAAASGAPFAVACGRWALVRRTAQTLSVSICGARACGPETTWSLAHVAAPVTPPPHGDGLLRSKWTWIAVSAATVVGATVAAWRLGAFDRPAAPAPTWRWEGAR